jgi:hypothetical protein
MKMRLGILAAGALSLAISTPAGANTLNFGSITSSATACTTAGNSGDRSCTHTGSVTNGVNDATASANVRGQSSADHGITTNPTAIADMSVQYDIPYTITRTVTNPANSGWLEFPLQTITFNMTVSGQVGKDNSQIGGGLGLVAGALGADPDQATAYTISAASLGGRFTTASYAGAALTGGGGLVRTTLSYTSPDPSWAAGVNASGASAGEISFVIQVPTDYREWTDLSAPLAEDYTLSHSYTQSLTDTLRVTFRLRAESRPSGSISTTGGEAMACMGQTSPLGSFSLNTGSSCGSGVDIVGTVSQTGTSTLVNVAIPEPSTLLLIGAGIAGLAYVGRTKLG